MLHFHNMIVATLLYTNSIQDDYKGKLKMS